MPRMIREADAETQLCRRAQARSAWGDRKGLASGERHGVCWRQAAGWHAGWHPRAGDTPGQGTPPGRGTTAPFWRPRPGPPVLTEAVMKVTPHCWLRAASGPLGCLRFISPSVRCPLSRYCQWACKSLLRPACESQARVPWKLNSLTCSQSSLWCRSE